MMICSQAMLKARILTRQDYKVGLIGLPRHRFRKELKTSLIGTINIINLNRANNPELVAFYVD